MYFHFFLITVLHFIYFFLSFRNIESVPAIVFRNKNKLTKPLYAVVSSSTHKEKHYFNSNENAVTTLNVILRRTNETNYTETYKMKNWWAIHMNERTKSINSVWFIAISYMFRVRGATRLTCVSRFEGIEKKYLKTKKYTKLNTTGKISMFFLAMFLLDALLSSGSRFFPLSSLSRFYAPFLNVC